MCHCWSGISGGNISILSKNLSSENRVLWRGVLMLLSFDFVLTFSFLKHVGGVTVTKNKLVGDKAEAAPPQ